MTILGWVYMVSVGFNAAARSVFTFYYFSFFLFEK